MLTVKECRQILKEEAIKLTDQEIIMIRDWLRTMAEIAIGTHNEQCIIKKNHK